MKTVKYKNKYTGKESTMVLPFADSGKGYPKQPTETLTQTGQSQGLDPRLASILAGQSLVNKEEPPKQTVDTRNLSLLQKILPIAFGIGGAALGALSGPGGAIAGGAAGASLGQGLQEATDEEEGINTGRVLKEAAFGAAGGVPLGPTFKLLGLGGKSLPGVAKVGQMAGGAADDVVRRSANALLQGTDAQVANALKFGISPQEELVRFVPKFAERGATTLEQMVGKTAKTGRQVRRGVIDDILDEEVAFVDEFAKTTGKNVKLTGANVIKSLEARAKERKLLLNLGEDDAEIRAIDEYIASAYKKYGRKGISLDEAVRTVREANKKFAQTIASTEKGAVRPVVQKIEADGLREALQGFPDIQRSLADQQALLTLKPFLGNSAVKNVNNKFSLSQIDITKPGSVIDMVMNNQKVAQKTVQYGSKIPGAGATPIASRTTQEALTKAAPTIQKRIFNASMKNSAARILEGSATPQETDSYNKTTALAQAQEQVTQMDQDLLAQVGELDSQISDGVQLPDGSTITKEQVQQMWYNDMVTTGGKNLSKIKMFEDRIFREEATKKVSAEVQKQTIGLAGASAAIDMVEQQMGILNPDQSGPGQRVKGLFLRGAGVLGNAPEAKQYNEFRKAMVGFLAKSISAQVGSLSDLDVERAEGWLPKLTDTAEEVALKIAAARQFIQARQQALQAVPQTMTSGQYPEYGESFTQE